MLDICLESTEISKPDGGLYVQTAHDGKSVRVVFKVARIFHAGRHLKWVQYIVAELHNPIQYLRDVAVRVKTEVSIALTHSVTGNFVVRINEIAPGVRTEHQTSLCAPIIRNVDHVNSEV